MAYSFEQLKFTASLKYCYFWYHISKILKGDKTEMETKNVMKSEVKVNIRLDLRWIAYNLMMLSGRRGEKIE